MPARSKLYFTSYYTDCGAIVYLFEVILFLKSFVLRIKLEKKFELFKPKAFTMTTSVVVSRPGLGLGLGLKTIFADIGSWSPGLGLG